MQRSPENRPLTLALIVAAGRGHRFGGHLPKQYAALGGEMVLRRTLQKFLGHEAISGVLVAIHPDDERFFHEASAGLAGVDWVAGGATRQASVRAGLEKMAEASPSPERVLIHDGARPFVDAATISATLDAIRRAPGAIAAIPMSDTVKREMDGRIEETVDRRSLWRAQTPQTFRFDEILAAHRAASHEEFSDDAAVMEAAGKEVVLVSDSPDNFKITTPPDLARAEKLVAAERQLETRTGSGFDVHRLGPGDHVMLCGLRIPHDATLLGHSDADVALHAITDAILGALSAGDIGSHFPPSDPQWKGADSAHFLAEAARLVREVGGEIRHVDVTIICERPKMGPHRDAARSRIAEILGMNRARVSVKATTTETLGFTGRGEGIAAQAAATLALPGGPL